MSTILRADDLMMVGSDGGGWCAPLGTAQPSDIYTYPPAPWLALGGISGDGLVVAFDEDSEAFTPWGRTSPSRTVITKSVRTFQITAWESNRPIVQSLMYRKDIADLAPDVNGVISFAEAGTAAPDRRSFIFDVYDGTVIRRFHLPEAEITDRGDTTFKQDEVVAYEWTISAYPDSAGNIVYHKIVTPEVEAYLS